MLQLTVVAITIFNKYSIYRKKSHLTIEYKPQSNMNTTKETAAFLAVVSFVEDFFNNDIEIGILKKDAVIIPNEQLTFRLAINKSLEKVVKSKDLNPHLTFSDFQGKKIVTSKDAVEKPYYHLRKIVSDPGFNLFELDKDWCILDNYYEGINPHKVVKLKVPNLNGTIIVGVKNCRAPKSVQ